MDGIRSDIIVVLAGFAALLGGCDFAEAFKTPEPWKVGVDIDGASDALCTAKIGTKVSQARVPGNIEVPRWVPDPIPPKTKFDPPKYLPLQISCEREGYLSAEITLRETREGWAITGIKYWPGYVPTSSIARYQRSPTAFTVPMLKAR